MRTPLALAEPSDESRALAGLQVLVVDGTPGSRETLIETLSEEGATALGVGDADAALAALDRARAASASFTSVLLGVQTAGGDAVGIAERIVAADPGAAARLVALLPAGHAEQLSRLRALGVRHCLTKPARHADLLAALRAGRVAPRPVPVPAVAPPPTPRTVLVADDSAVNRAFIVRLLEKRGHRVVTVDDGRQAVAAVARERFDVVLMDVQMPVMDGLQATMAIRHREEADGGRVPIGALTAHDQPSDAERCRAAGMDAHLTKPPSVEALLRIVERPVEGTPTPADPRRDQSRRVRSAASGGPTRR